MRIDFNPRPRERKTPHLANPSIGVPHALRLTKPSLLSALEPVSYRSAADLKRLRLGNAASLR